MDEEKRENSEDVPEGKKETADDLIKDSSPKTSMVNNSNKETLTDKMRENPWIAATLVLGVLSLILIVGNFSGSLTGNVVSGNDVGQALLESYQANGVTGLTLDSVEEESGLYIVNFEYQGAIVPVYATKDGKLAGSMSTIKTGSSSGSVEVEKSDRPEVGLYIWSYCPYGVTALGPFAQVASLLEDYADFRVYLYYAGHGEFEVQQNKIQACMQDLGVEQYWEYAETFANTIYKKCSGDVACDLEESTKLMDSLGIDSAAVLSCVDSRGEDLLDADYEAAGEVGVTSSPSLVVNGAKVSASRDAESYKDAVCSAFNDVPSACGEELDSTAATTSGSC